MKPKRAVIVSACRTPIGSFQGDLSTLLATNLGSHVIRESLSRASLDANQVNEVIMGQVLTAGAGQAPARQAALDAGIPHTTPCLTINKVCGSGLKSIMLAADAIELGRCEIVVAGGMESMTNAPYLVPHARRGYTLGHGTLIDSVIHDGLWDVSNDFHMGDAAELCAKKYGVGRQAQDDYAKESYNRALAAQEQNYFDKEIVPITISTRKGNFEVTSDEEPQRIKFEKISVLKPAFQPDGTVTAFNASSINDGAAACIVTSEHKAKELGLEPLSYISKQATTAKAPEWFTTAPIDCVKKILSSVDLDVSDIDLFEINEAFSVVTLVAMKELGIEHSKLNIHGGAVALGHPIGASGARLLVTLLYALKQHELRRGIAALCIGGGEAVGVLLDRKP